MLFVRVGNYHINVENIVGFKLTPPSLIIFVRGQRDLWIHDPDGSKYKKLCESIGVRPVEEE